MGEYMIKTVRNFSVISSRWNRGFARLAAPIFLGTVLATNLAVAADHSAVATNVGEHAPKFDGGPGVAVYPDQSLELKMKIGSPFSVAAIGDLLESQPFSTDTDPRIQFLVAKLRSADMTFANLENTVFDFDKFGYYGLNLAPKEVADDWAHMGIKMVSRANNQRQSAPGIWEQFRQVERVGITHVGVGHSLGEARRARFMATPKGLVGFIGVYAVGGTHDTCCAGGETIRVTKAQLAQIEAIKASILARRSEVEVPIPLPPADQRGVVNLFELTFALPGVKVVAPPAPRAWSEDFLGTPPKRPYDELTTASLGSPVDGVENTLHVTLYYGVTSKQMSVLREIAHDSGSGGDLNAFGKHFRVMALPGEYSFDIDPQDLRQILTQIKTAKEACDFLAVNVHWHQNRYAFQHYSFDHFPADFEIRFAHAAIDEGADLVIGQGVHTIKGVEIYKDRVVYYGVSNYIFQSGLMPTMGYETGDLLAGYQGLPGTESPNPKPDGHGVVGLHQRQGLWEMRANLEALLGWSHYEGGRLSDVEIYPVDLGQTYRPTDHVGIPMEPSPAVATKILDEVAAYSKPFGTQMQIQDGVGIISIR